MQTAKNIISIKIQNYKKSLLGLSLTSDNVMVKLIRENGRQVYALP